MIARIIAVMGLGLSLVGCTTSPPPPGFIEKQLGDRRVFIQQSIGSDNVKLPRGSKTVTITRTIVNNPDKTCRGLGIITPRGMSCSGVRFGALT